MASMHPLLTILVLALVACDKPAAPTPAGSSGSPAANEAPKVTPPPRDPGFGSVAFKTFHGGTTTIRFNTSSKVQSGWGDMSGSETVHGTYEQDGSEVVVHWDPKYTNNHNSEFRFHQMGPCSMALYERTDRRTRKKFEETLIFQQTQPRCDSVRLTR
jgi:hypothetical protein